MRFLNIAVIAGTTVFFAGCLSSRPSDDQLLTEFTKINTRLDKIEAEVKKNNPSNVTIESVSQPGIFSRTNSQKEILDKIKLPPEPSREDVKKYIREIQASARNQHGFSSTDPQVDMFVQLGEKNLDLLLDAMLNDQSLSHTRDFHIKMAIEKMEISDDSKDIIIKALRKNPDLITIVIRNVWEQDAKEIIKEILMDPANNIIPAELIQAAAFVRDPGVNDALINYFIYGYNRSNTYRILKNRSNVNISDEVIENAWNQARLQTQRGECNDMAAIAVFYGQQSALETLINRDAKVYNGENNSSTWDSAVRRSVDCAGSMTDIKKWYDANHNNIVFDRVNKKFKVKKKD